MIGTYHTRFLGRKVRRDAMSMLRGRVMSDEGGLESCGVYTRHWQGGNDVYVKEYKGRGGWGVKAIE